MHHGVWVQADKEGMWSLHAAHSDFSSGVDHKEIIKDINGGRWFALAVWDGMRRQGRVLINFSSSADGGQKSRINHGGQQQSASLLARTRARCDKLHVSCSIIKQGSKDNRDSTKDICFSLFWPLTSLTLAFEASLKVCCARNILYTLHLKYMKHNSSIEVYIQSISQLFISSPLHLHVLFMSEIDVTL